MNPKHLIQTGLLCCTLIVPASSFAAKCKDYSRCEQAVKAWCAGKHPRADRDKDGIPCENVCRSQQQVKKIKQKIKNKTAC